MAARDGERSHAGDRIVVQDVTAFTVGIQDAQHRFRGTGIAVAGERIITAKHVVQDAADGDGHLFAYFPRTGGGAFPILKARRVDVRLPDARSLWELEDDVAILELVDDDWPWGPERSAVLGTLGAIGRDQRFKSYGYHLKPSTTSSGRSFFLATAAEGRIVESVEILASPRTPRGAWLVDKLLQLECQQIDSGMSGAGVLDLERNLVVGIISEKWRSAGAAEHRDTGYAVDIRVITFTEGLELPVRSEPLRPERAPRPPRQTPIGELPAALSPLLRGIPEPVPPSQWVGRADLLDELDQALDEGQRRVVSLVGFGGQGKSALARRWLDRLLEWSASDRPGAGRPEAVVWWSFSSQPNVDAFFEKVFEHLIGREVDYQLLADAEDGQVAQTLANVLGAILPSRRMLFILDSFEHLQRREGDDFGRIENPALRAFLRFLASPRHHCFSLVTSRLPLLDLVALPATCGEIRLGPLSDEEGASLLAALGVRDGEAPLAETARRFGAHPLTLRILAPLLAQGFEPGADVDFEASGLGDGPSRQLTGLLETYDRLLSPEERGVILLLAAFRRPPSFDLLATVLSELQHAKRQATHFPGKLAGRLGHIDRDELRSHLHRLADVFALVTADRSFRKCRLHPLVASFYSKRLDADPALSATLHGTIARRLARRKLSAKKLRSKDLALSDFEPLIEAVHHRCRAGQFDRAFKFYRDRIQRYEMYALTRHLNAWDSDLELLLGFFPDRDLGREPLIEDAELRLFLLQQVAIDLQNLRQSSRAIEILERAIELAAERKDRGAESFVLRRLASVLSRTGPIAEAVSAAERAVELSKKLRDRITSLIWLGWNRRLAGDGVGSLEAFVEAGELGERHTREYHLGGSRGMLFGVHLLESGEAEEARRVAGELLEVSREQQSSFFIQNSLALLGRIALAQGDDERVSEVYFELGAETRDQPASDSAFMVLGDLALAEGDLGHARSVLDALLARTRETGEGITEVSTRLLRGRLFLATGEAGRASKECAFARRTAERLGFGLGVERAKALEAEIAKAIPAKEQPSGAEAAFFLRLLKRRFGPLDAPTREKIEAASADQIENWADRLFEAGSIEEALTDG